MTDKIKRKKEMNRELQKITAVLKEKYKPERIILFGSIARGEERVGSDIDLLLVKKNQEKRAFRAKNVFMALRNLKRNYPLDPIIYTPEELEKRLALGDYFIRRVLAEGKILYE